MRVNIKFSSLYILMALAVPNVHAVQWLTTYDGSTTQGNAGTITLDDWGFIGPQGRQADSFEPYGGVFGNGMYETMGAAYCIADPAACGIGQMQHVVTSGADGITPDAPALIKADFLSTTGDFQNANVDSLTTFFQWGYTTAAGSTFNNMMIDLDGDYHIAKEDMTFEWYNSIDYTQVIPDGQSRVGTNPDGEYFNGLGFQPYVVSDGKGWCGSVTAPHPNAHVAMAGQIKFDIIMDVYQRNPATGALVFFSSELTPDFEMRSFGDITVDFPGSGQAMNARAVVNNTDAGVTNQTVGPVTPLGDLSWHNRVSFMGANILPAGGWCGLQSAEWLGGARGIGVKRYDAVRKDLTTQLDCEVAGGNWDYNSFAGFAYILRADGGRFIDYFDENIYGPDPMVLDADNNGVIDYEDDNDADGVLNYADNCTSEDNIEQLDTDLDGYGNHCDADFNNDGSVDSQDIGLFKPMFFTAGNVEADLNGDGIVNSLDIGIFKARFFQPPGPSATGTL